LLELHGLHELRELQALCGLRELRELLAVPALRGFRALHELRELRVKEWIELGESEVNLAKKVRQVRELKKAYESQRNKVLCEYDVLNLFSFKGLSLEQAIAHYVLECNENCIYFLDVTSNYIRFEEFANGEEWFACEDDTFSFSDAKKVAKKLGFKTEIVTFESETKALKITWGE
jgi:hypothetical protein